MYVLTFTHADGKYSRHVSTDRAAMILAFNVALMAGARNLTLVVDGSPVMMHPGRKPTE